MEKLKQKTLFLLLFLTSWLPLHAEPYSKPFAHKDSPMPADPSVVYGELDNGFKYAIMKNAEPKDRVSVRLYVNAGSLMETNEEQGLAHFLEHVAFKGSKNFPKNGLIEYLQRLGIGFGNDTNAHTGFDATVYELDLPNVDPETLKTGLTVMRDYAGSLDIEEEAVQSEKGVVLSELRMRDTADYRIWTSLMQQVMADSLYAKRLPIGKEEKINAANNERLRAFYQKWYTPQRMFLAVVGDFTDTLVVEKQIRELFVDLNGTCADNPDYGKLSLDNKLRIGYVYDTGSSAVDIQIAFAKPYVFEKDAEKRFRESVLKNLILTMLKYRFQERLKAPYLPFTQLQAGFFKYEAYSDEMNFSAQCEPQKWKKCLCALNANLQCVWQYGFHESELELAKQAALNNSREGLANKDKRQSQLLVDGLIDDYDKNGVFMSPETYDVCLKKVLAEIDTEVCYQYFLTYALNPVKTVIVAGNVTINNPVASILKIYTQDQDAFVEPSKDYGLKDFPYALSTEPGTIIQEQHNDALDVDSYVLDNRVRLNLKKTDFDKTVSVCVSFGKGLASLPQDKPALAQVADAIFIDGGLGQMSREELKRFFAGREIGTFFDFDDDHFELNGIATSADVGLLLQVLCAYVVDPGYRSEALEVFRRELNSEYELFRKSFRGVRRTQVLPFLTCNDYRYVMPPQEVVAAMNSDDVKGWLQTALTKEYMEVAIVGDFDKVALLEAFKSTFGALPKRADTKEIDDSKRVLLFPPAQTKDFTVEDKNPSARIGMLWPTTDMSNIDDIRKLNVLSQVLTDCLLVKIRQKMSATYSPQSGMEVSRFYKDRGSLFFMSDAAPDKIDVLTEAMAGVAKEVVENGISDDAFVRAKNPFLHQVEKMRRTNQYWLNMVLNNAQLHPEYLTWAETMLADIQNMQKTDVEQVAKKYLSTNPIVYVIRPL
ncbi:MAG: hypothetical protein A2Y14_03940 [Verrucomicrobia bacterium GWF2_51_19]|nr:MAG: hypothetical protein A2Y14_03940 [Verrucomicrobia bacterium GWF2_51_19]HCJ11689.1 hypothetical protein [Opitutae bacterium]